MPCHFVYVCVHICTPAHVCAHACVPVYACVSIQVPTIAIVGSGGGFRAMVCFSGVMKALYESGVLDCATYVAGLSGSTWLVGRLLSFRCTYKIIGEQHTSTVYNYHSYASTKTDQVMTLLYTESDCVPLVPFSCFLSLLSLSLSLSLSPLFLTPPSPHQVHVYAVLPP